MWRKIKKDYQSGKKSKILIINESNLVLNLAKRAIFCLHRDDFKRAEKFLIQAERKIIKIYPELEKSPGLEYAGVYKAALEEYVEAKLFWQVLKQGKIELIKDIDLKSDDYLAASCDLTGELVRKMIILVTQKKYQKAKEMQRIINEVTGELIQLDLTGYLRQKYDEAKRNLKKAEEILYDLEIRDKFNYNC